MNKKTRDLEKAVRVARTAEITRRSKSLVYKVTDGERENEHVMLVYMELKEGENKLVEAAKKLVPFNKD